MKNLKKKSQDGTNAAILIAILSAFIIIYIMFLPSEDRQDILEGDGSGVGSSSSPSKITLLKESVGRLDPVSKVRDKALPNVNIFEATNAKVLEQFNPLTVRNGWFEKKPRKLSFILNDVDQADNVFLSFSAPVRKGILAIAFNGEVIFESRLAGINVEPIKVRRSLLKKENELLFSVSSVGARFWTANEYTLQDIKLIGDITDRSRQESQNSFSLSDKEVSNIEKAELRFVPYCTNALLVGSLGVSVNSRSVFSAVPVCNDKYTVEIPLSALNAGSNSVMFRTDKGTYAVEQIRLAFTQKEEPETTFFFEVNESTFKKVSGNNATHNAFFGLKFVDDRDIKKADININDRFIRIDQDEKAFRKNINSFIEKDNNFVKITPRSVLEIVEVSVELERR
ncbi:hypothetical protein HYU14_06695 [Candidatus Woesearchaeota archaeon]|nr:hypothetical protein [Candidatus Woesearchaeota archaeon]